MELTSRVFLAKENEDGVYVIVNEAEIPRSAIPGYRTPQSACFPFPIDTDGEDVTERKDDDESLTSTEIVTTSNKVLTTGEQNND